MSTLYMNEAGISEALRQVEAAMVNVAPEVLPELIGELERLKAASWTRLSTPPREEASADRLLGAQEAAAMLGIEATALYRKAWPFKVKVSKGRSRYSLHGIQRFIRNREGR